MLGRGITLHTAWHLIRLDADLQDGCDRQVMKPIGRNISTTSLGTATAPLTNVILLMFRSYGSINTSRSKLPTGSTLHALNGVTTSCLSRDGTRYNLLNLLRGGCLEHSTDDDAPAFPFDALHAPKAISSEKALHLFNRSLPGSARENASKVNRELRALTIDLMQAFCSSGCCRKTGNILKVVIPGGFEIEFMTWPTYLEDNPFQLQLRLPRFYKSTNKARSKFPTFV